MPFLPNGPARRTAITQLIGFICLPILCILLLLGYILLTRNVG